MQGGEAENPPLPEGEGWGEGKRHPTTNPSSHNATALTHHSAEPVSVEAKSDNAAKQDKKSPSSMSALADLDSDTPDCYIEPPSPEVQVAFDHEVRIETGAYPEGKVPSEPPPPPPNAQATFEADLKRVREAAARDGVPVRPNPLAARLRAPTIRSP